MLFFSSVYIYKGYNFFLSKGKCRRVALSFRGKVNS